MPDDTSLMPAAQAGQFGNLAPQLGGAGLPPSLQILLNDSLYDKVKQLSGVMARAQGFTPQHLLGKPEACFTVITIALDSRLSPNFVARHTYQTPGGQIGYDGALVQSILEQSGRFIGPPLFEYVGDWGKLRGKFEKRQSQKGNEYIVPTWTANDAVGLGVIVRWRVKGEENPRCWPSDKDPFWLTQCYPLNSPLWATDPKSQIAYLAIRRFANFTSPGILGAAAVNEAELLDASETAIDITPQREPRREDFEDTPLKPTGRQFYDVVDLDGEIHVYSDPDHAVAAVEVVLRAASRQGIDHLDAAWENNQNLFDALDRKTSGDLAGEYADLRERVVEEAKKSAAEVVRRHQEAAASEASGGGDGEVDPRLAAAAEPQRRRPDAEEPDDGLSGKPGHAGGADRSSAPSQQVSQPAHAGPAAAANGPEPADETPPAPSSPARDNDTREGQRVPVPMKRGTDKPDYRAWAVALFRPKLRRQIDATALPYFLGDNEQAIEACRNGGLARDELAALEADIKYAWARCK